MIKKIYKNNWIFLKQAKKYIFASLIIFFAFALIGFFFPVLFRQEILEMIHDLILKFEGKNLAEIIIFIFFNNLWTSFIAMILGLLFGIIPLIIVLINGYILGFASNMSVKEQGLASLWRLLPHGIFELPAVIISIGLGLRLGFLVIQNKPVKKEILKSLIFFLSIIAPLLIIAAIIEGILIFSVS